MEREDSQYAVAVQNDDAWHFEEDGAAELGYKGSSVDVYLCVRLRRSSKHAKHPARPRRQIVQGRPNFEIRETDRGGRPLYCDVYVDSVREAHGTQIIVTNLSSGAGR